MGSRFIMAKCWSRSTKIGNLLNQLVVIYQGTEEEVLTAALLSPHGCPFGYSVYKPFLSPTTLSILEVLVKWAIADACSNIPKSKDHNNFRFAYDAVGTYSL